ncbi:MAG: alpha/beta hydrolase [Thaumarchaeota archaeon]|nr:alpha/beta hydrolase [Nitrososphaerota archaeon]
MKKQSPWSTRLRRLDKVGETAPIRYSRNIAEVKSQRWIIEDLYRLLGRGSFFWDNPAEGLGVGVAKGHNYFDLMKTGERIKTIDASCKENTAMAKELESVARREDSAGHPETAREFYHRATLFYEAAAWPIFDSDDPEFIWLNQKIDECFDKVLASSPYPAERVEIPFGGKSLPGIFYATPSRERAPTVLVIPGMDERKERVVNPRNNWYVNRGMNCLALDGPGQGASLLRKIWVDRDNHGTAGKAAIDQLVKRKEVDANKIGVWGNSMGSYWAPLVAIKDRRVKALVTAMSCYYDKNHIFDETSPNFRLRFMWMAGADTDEEFDRLAEGMTLEGKEHLVKCPSLVLHGELDHLTNTSETYRYFNALGSRVKELRIYESQFHGIARFNDDIYMSSTDWLRDRLNGVPPLLRRRVVLVDWARQEHPVDEKALAGGFSYFRKAAE